MMVEASGGRTRKRRLARNRCRLLPQPPPKNSAVSAIASVVGVVGLALVRFDVGDGSARQVIGHLAKAVAVFIKRADFDGTGEFNCGARQSEEFFSHHFSCGVKARWRAGSLAAASYLRNINDPN